MNNPFGEEGLKMRCNGFKDWFSTYLDGEIHERERIGLEAHLRECAECSREMDSLRKLDGLMEKHLEEAELPEEFGSKVLKRVREIIEEREKKPLWSLRLPHPIHPLWKTALTAALVIFVLMVPIYRTTFSEEAMLLSIQKEVDQQITVGTK